MRFEFSRVFAALVVFAVMGVGLCAKDGQSDESGCRQAVGQAGAVAAEAGPGEKGALVSAREVLGRVRRHNFEKNSGYRGVGDLSDEAWRVRTLAIRDLVRLGSVAVGQLRAGLRDENRHVRHVCVTVLGILRVREAAEELVELLTGDADPIVRGQAAEALGQIGYKEAVSALKAVRRQVKNPNIKYRAKLAIARINEGAEEKPELVKVWKQLDERTFRLAQVGQRAPDFELKDTFGKSWRLSDFKNKKSVVLIWIFADWCPVCHREFHDLIKMEGQFRQADVQVLTIECHDKYRCKVMVGGRDLWWPHLVDNAGAVGAMYGVDPLEFVVKDEWINRPSVVIVDAEGIIRFAYYGTTWADRPTIGQTLEMVRTNSYTFSHPQRRQ